MFVFDLKDFRQLPTLHPTITEESCLAALTEAGVTFDHPLGLKVRLKDYDPRLMFYKWEPVDGSTEEFRLNLYFPPIDLTKFPDDTTKDAVTYALLSTYNACIRHAFKHIAQVRANHGVELPDDVDGEALEEAAREHQYHGEGEAILNLDATPLPQEAASE